MGEIVRGASSWVAKGRVLRELLTYLHNPDEPNDTDEPNDAQELYTLSRQQPVVTLSSQPALPDASGVRTNGAQQEVVHG